jgi:hypothetical protein
VCRSKHVEPSVNFGIINSITKLCLVGISTESHLKSRMTCIAAARSQFNMGLDLYLFVLKCILHVHCDVNLP